MADVLRLTTSGLIEGDVLKDETTCYLVMGNKLRAVPNPETYKNLFGSFPPKAVVIAGDVPRGDDFSNGACLVVADNGHTYYLVSNSVIRGFTSADHFNKYHFDAAQVKKVPHVLIEFIPPGSNI